MLNTSLLINYLKHLIKAKTRHGVHSPFVYKLIDTVIYDFINKPEYFSIENLRKTLIKDKRIIAAKLIKAQPNANAYKMENVWAKNAVKPKINQLLYRIALEFKPKNILELGTGLGISTAYFSKACADAKIYTLEENPEIAAIAQTNFETLELKNIEIIKGDVEASFSDAFKQIDSLDLVHISGNQTKKAMLYYFENCLLEVHPESVLIIEDLYSCTDRKVVWEQIKVHPQVSVTIDLFWIGLVFFRKGQVKEHFRVKF